MSTPQELKAITRRFIEEAWSKGNVDVLDEICHPNYRLGDATASDLKSFITETHKAMPDFETRIIGDMIADENSVAYRFEMTGTHLGKSGELAPTGKYFSSTGITILHFQDGKIIRDEFESSSPSFEQQTTP